MTKERNCIESHEFTKSLEALGDIRRLDEAMISVTEHLRFLAEDCQVVPGTKKLRVIETTPVLMRDGTVLPGLALWFKISNDNNSVELLHVEYR